MAISVGPEYTKIEQDVIRNIVSINRLSRLVEESRPNVDVASNSRTNADTNPKQKARPEKEKNSYAGSNASDSRIELLRHTILSDGMAKSPTTTLSGLASIVPTISQSHIDESYDKVIASLIYKGKE